MVAIAPGALVNLKKDAHYHPIAASAKWAEFVQAMQVAAVDPADERAARSEQRERETTYARGTTGGS
jgi:hypothetical protein